MENTVVGIMIQQWPEKSSKNNGDHNITFCNCNKITHRSLLNTV